ncbi:hypothetical protein D3C71_2193180 [compost metagenome]
MLSGSVPTEIVSGQDEVVLIVSTALLYSQLASSWPANIAVGFGSALAVPVIAMDGTARTRASSS